MSKEKILVTGAAGFVGAATSLRLLAEGYEVYGIDNMNDYYPVVLKEHRLEELKQHKNFHFKKIDLVDNNTINEYFDENKDFTYIINLAAQAGVRYSSVNPDSYYKSNVIGFENIVSNLKKLKSLKLFLYASSSSVYGKSEEVPYKEGANIVNSQVSLYATTKILNESRAGVLTDNENIPSVGLRFFTVYGPKGRPDMAYFKFIDKILHDEPITVFKGEMSRDMTYIDDIVDGIFRCFSLGEVLSHAQIKHKIINLGNDKPVKLNDLIRVCAQACGKDLSSIKQNKQEKPAGDVKQTWADIGEARKLGYNPQNNIEARIPQIVKWMQDNKELMNDIRNSSSQLDLMK